MSPIKKEAHEFIDFIRGQGVVGLTIAFVIGVAVKDTVDALVGSIINPLVALLLPADRLSEATFNIGESVFSWGLLVSAVLNLLIVAAVVYFLFKKLRLDKLDKKEE